ncbi:SIS domain-containing protein [Enterococcus gallinarum]|uniref:SIS domain-containing protein n=1 Tax=Enterococcus gallinarum TaxID=1353 RepID=UPI001E30F32D|nr:SIS domain-containing protein [Enterococcus gallinarum]MCD5186164.1 SIS domain-containing protein [Enterococcus gallinarum]
MGLSYDQCVLDELALAMDKIDEGSLEAAKETILQTEADGGRVHVTGIGKPSYVAGYIASLLSSTGTPSYFLDGTEAVHGSSGQVKAGDVVIAISNSGETKELLYTVETLKNNGTKIIGVSKRSDSTLSHLSDVSLCAAVHREGDLLNKPPRLSVLVQIIVLQKLSLLLQEARKLTPEMYVQWHPGGAIGESLIQQENC